MTPMDLRSKEEWEGLLTRVAEEVRMTACLTDAKGGIIMGVGDRYPLCGAIRANQEAISFICSQTNMAMLSVIQETRQPEVDLCEVGLLRMVVPIFRDNELVGQVTACGLVEDPEDLDTFLASKELNIAEEQVEDLAKTTPSGSKDELLKVGKALFKELHP